MAGRPTLTAVLRYTIHVLLSILAIDAFHECSGEFAMMHCVFSCMGQLLNFEFILSIHLDHPEGFYPSRISDALPKFSFLDTNMELTWRVQCGCVSLTGSSFTRRAQFKSLILPTRRSIVSTHHAGLPWQSRVCEDFFADLHPRVQDLTGRASKFAEKGSDRLPSVCILCSLRAYSAFTISS